MLNSLWFTLVIYAFAIGVTNAWVTLWIQSVYRARLSIDDEAVRREIIEACEKKTWTEWAVEFGLEGSLILAFFYAQTTYQLLPGPRWVPIIVLIALVLPTRQYLLAKWAIHGKLPRVLRERGLCRRCGYDLQSRPGLCPECGYDASDDWPATSSETGT